ncbi:hypothetical protein BCR39DRAFT_566413 [Naematelia encephala]|uniref:Peptidase M20 dimerisation domain-containing protein n=1 Tax=Naematelia encephala TaxID=71784 RepID=A0A1Y2AS67_9TREE|nr:hypothetical protein BCR39DRAFT_566413 [Naematelia encephala]
MSLATAKQVRSVLAKLWYVSPQSRLDELISTEQRIRTESFDDNGKPDEDPRFDTFPAFHKWLHDAFPVVFSIAEFELINTLGIVTTVRGSDPALKPIILMAHYDVVPAPNNTLEQWIHPPFSGHYDGEWVWGRGASDTKTLIVAQYEAMTALLEAGFQPRRTVIFSHGFDEEEPFARQGAAEIAKHLEKVYGFQSILLVVDEGAASMNKSGLSDVYGAPFAVPASAEKGYLDVKISVVGIMSDVVHAIEAHPWHPGFLACASEHSPNFPKRWSKMIQDEGKWNPSSRNTRADIASLVAALVTTTQAVDVISGGAKVNALPEVVEVLMNHRIALHNDVATVKEHLRKVLEPVAKLHNLTIAAFEAEGNHAHEIGQRYVQLQSYGASVDPVTRSVVAGPVWEMFSGTIRHVHPGINGRDTVVSPFATTGSTDTKVFLNLSRAIYRFAGGPETAHLSYNGHHTVNEKASVTAHLHMARWVHALIQNADAYDGPE